ncbi:MAG: UDP-3-O-(3-hydroxymyristoyl)glucosamine N-acyltransferase [Marinisporobacter sp.]|jgi:UDP-3-O-[3-hydroxymyristoyl] glucosamine N-acyltransferase|nr:UDP-3-O-(3-hydroxymyristoyl)glucosamine N-acyltransferase [Marinisporobacter sp.]
MLSLVKNVSQNANVYQDGYFDNLGFTRTKSSNEKLLVFLNDSKYLPEFYRNKNISCVICSKNIFDAIKDIDNMGICITDEPKELFYKFHNYLFENTNFYKKKLKNQIDDTAQIHPTAYIEDHNVIIKKGAVIEANVTILNNVYIGENTIIRAGTVIGSEGFQFIRTKNDIISVKHAGKVIIHNDVEVQANSCVCKGVFNDITEIGEKTKIDNLVHIPHGVKIGKRCLIVANAMIGGYVTIGDDVWIGPSSSIVNSIDIGDQADIKIGAVVTKNVESGQSVSGNFAIEHSKFINFIKSIR